MLSQTLNNSFVSFTTSMRSVALIVFLFSCSVNLVAQSPQNNTPPNTVKLLSKEDSVQYALGVYFGHWIMRSGFTTLSPNILMSGINDVVRNLPRQVADSAAFPMIYAYRIDLYKENQKKTEDDFFAFLKNKADVQDLPGGIKYMVRKTGNGNKPAETDSVVINFKGSLLDGTVFEDTYAKKISIVTLPRNVLPGLKQALLSMPEGSVWDIYIPSAMAYGDKGNGTTIPPHNALVMLVELIRVKQNVK